VRLLFVAPSVPYPPLAGSAMISLNQIRRLAVRHTVDLISFKRKKNPSELGELPRWCNEIELIDRPPRWRVAVNVLSGIVRDPHIGISWVRSAEMERAVHNRLQGRSYDVVLFQTLLTAQFLPSWYRGRTVLCLEDPTILKMQRMMLLSRWYKRPVILNSIARLRRYERRHASGFDRVILVNEQDCIDYRKVLPELSLDYVPSGIDIEAFRPSSAISRRRGMIVITGNMNHPPNVDGVEYFCKEIFPLICQRVPSATLWLVGAGPVSRVRKWTRDSRIKVTGFVPDIRPYLQEAMVSVCPVRLRIGTQTKVLEALACGTPVVTSSAGNHGIRAVSGEHLFVADDPVTFADVTVTLLTEDRWSAFSQNGRRFVEDNFAWQKSVEKLQQILERLTAARELEFARG
jgi:glycosyltransferase involved in cell wall biosynthesis